jgi:hypothetical protein
MVAGLRDDPQIRELLQQSKCKVRAFAIGDEGIKASQRFRESEGSGEDLHLGALPQSANASGLPIGIMYVIQDRNTHETPLCGSGAVERLLTGGIP